MTQTLRVVMAQLNFLVGDIEGNAKRIITAIHSAKLDYNAQLIVFPELALSGYPPEDLLFRHDLYQRIDRVLPEIQAAAQGIDVILGYPHRTTTACFNHAAWLRHGATLAHYDKQCLPNYSVFDEKRYFSPGDRPCVVDLHGVRIGVSICEDLWFPEPIAQARQAGAQLMISLNASPFAKQKTEQRQHIMATRAREAHMPIIYVNLVGGQDELVFDGGSMALDANGAILQQADSFTSGLIAVDIAITDPEPTLISQPLPPTLSEVERVYRALVLGVHDYIEKNAFPMAVIGLSGGIDSALTLAIAVDAIGKQRVEAVTMPSRYTSAMSIEDAQLQAQNLGVTCTSLSIEPVFQAFLTSLAQEFSGLAVDATEENLQARCRGTLLMAISNKKHAIVLATGNKSEMSMGYATLYGDMVGGFCVLKDVTKTLVYQLARYRNSLSAAIPQRVIERAPSAELAPNQLDQDTLPPYPILDAILERYIEHDESLETIVAAGFDVHTVRQILRAIDRTEYKRRQAAPGVRITERAFGKDRRYPITSGFGKYILER